MSNMLQRRRDRDYGGPLREGLGSLLRFFKMSSSQ